MPSVALVQSATKAAPTDSRTMPTKAARSQRTLCECHNNQQGIQRKPCVRRGVARRFKQCVEADRWRAPLRRRRACDARKRVYAPHALGGLPVAARAR
jgi:hypothetical protein